MKRLLGLVIVVVLSAGAAQATTAPQHRPLHRKPAVTHASYRAHVRKASTRRRIRHLGSVTATAMTPPRQPVAYNPDDNSGPSNHPGWFKTHDRAGWGVDRDGTQTMVGLYKRPETPDLPGPQIYHDESRGAAGIALSVPLGH